MESLLVLAIAWVIIGVIVALIANARGRDGMQWFFYAFLAPPIAFLHAISLHPNREALDAVAQYDGDQLCPSCHEYARKAALVCPHCSRDFPPKPEPPMRVA